MLVVDCSVLMAWIAPDETSNYARNIQTTIMRHNIPIIVPPLFFLEVMNVLDVMQKRNRVNAEQAENAFLFLQKLPITVDNESILLSSTLHVRQLMQQHGLTSYDASYIEVAKRRKISISTLDKALRKAAQAENLFFAPPAIPW